MPDFMIPFVFPSADCILQSSDTGGNAMKLSARNILKGKVKSILVGAVNDEVVLELPGGIEVVSVITKASAVSLGLKVGAEAYAVIKASSVMLAVD